MIKKYIKLSDEEKLIIKKMALISNIPETTIKSVFMALLMTCTGEYYRNNNLEFSIPYIAKFGVSLKNVSTVKGVETEVILDSTPLMGLTEEVIAIDQETITPSEQFIKNSLKSVLNKKIERKKEGK